jgi:hypothetical protein
MPLLLLNITTSANRWEFAPKLLLGQFLFWIILILAIIINYRTPYRKASIYLFLFGLLFGILQMQFQNIFFELLKIISFGLLLMMVGAFVYGKKLDFLSNQLVIFLSLCIPIMILQITGASSFFMVWNTEYGHDPLILSPDDYGKFNLIPVYPTLFLNSQDINYQIGQGRPCGLLDSNNVLSIFIAITNTIVFILTKNSKIRLKNIIVAISLTLSMSLMVLVIATFFYIYSILFSETTKKKLAIKSLLLLIFLYFLYYLFFPGLFVANFSEAKILGSLITRGVDLFNAIGFNSVGDLFYTQKLLIGDAFNEDASYSFYSAIFKNNYSYLIVVLILYILFMYYLRLKKFNKCTQRDSKIYIFLVITCLVTQFGVNYIAAPSFQVLLGVGFYPLFIKLW